MSQQKHTQGPWKVTKLHDGQILILSGQIVTPKSPDPWIKYTLAQVVNHAGMRLLYPEEDWMSKEETDANARLIAAAPIGAELVDAVISFAEAYNDRSRRHSIGDVLKRFDKMLALAREFKRVQEGEQ